MPYKDRARRNELKRLSRQRRWAENREKEQAKEKAYRARVKSKDYSAFKEANRIACHQRYQRNVDFYALMIRLRNHGLTLDQYHAKMESQDFQCAICGAETSKRYIKNELIIDHDHASEKRRGLLCHNCNSGIGHFRDDKSLLQSAIAYLVKYQGTTAANLC